MCDVRVKARVTLKGLRFPLDRCKLLFEQTKDVSEVVEHIGASPWWVKCRTAFKKSSVTPGAFSFTTSTKLTMPFSLMDNILIAAC